MFSCHLEKFQVEISISGNDTKNDCSRVRHVSFCQLFYDFFDIFRWSESTKGILAIPGKSTKLDQGKFEIRCSKQWAYLKYLFGTEKH